MLMPKMTHHMMNWAMYWPMCSEKCCVTTEKSVHLPGGNTAIHLMLDPLVKNK